MPITIKEIAQRAGVSRGTVDRVIHNRGNVAPYVRQKIEHVITELGYRPNVIASRLASHKEIHIALIIPHPSEDAYWNLPLSGIEDALQEYKHLGIHCSRYYFNLVEASSLIVALNKMNLGPAIDGIIIAPLFKKQAVCWFQEHRYITKPIMVINSPILLSPYAYYVGQNSYQGGQVAAKLIHWSQRLITRALIINIGPRANNAQHILDKEKGFREYFAAHEQQVIVDKIELADFSNDEYIKEQLNLKYAACGPFDAIFVSNSRAYRVIPAIRQLNKLKPVVIGFDLLAENIGYLKAGDIDYILDQNPKRQGYVAVKSVADHLIFGAPIREKEYLQTNIIVKENLLE